MSFVLRKINPPGKSAMAHEATALALLKTLGHGGPERGQYLEWADPDANNGMGDDRWTSDIDKAKKFATFADATACWQAQSVVNPIRPDGKPNRPLTAWSVCVERA
jgi:hypothetical protein